MGVRETIFSLFMEHNKRSFTEIEKALGIRSNAAAYHIDRMVQEGLLQKQGKYYRLTRQAERLLPIFPHITKREMTPLPIILVHASRHGKTLMLNRSKRPYKGYWSMIGGKMLLGESFAETALRLVKEKSGLEAMFKGINAVLYEHVEGEGITKHGFILFFVTVELGEGDSKESPYGPCEWFTQARIKREKIIPSDRWLLLNKTKSSIDVKSARMKEDDGQLSGFRITDIY